jgi:hypothetical protein
MPPRFWIGNLVGVNHGFAATARIKTGRIFSPGGRRVCPGASCNSLTSRILMEEIAMRGFYRIVTLCAIGTAVLAAPALAADSTPRVDTRQENQKDRIQQGVGSGELTRHETKNLIEGQRHVNRVEKRVGADGTVTGKEKLRLEKAQDRQSRRIYGLKHNARDRN